MSMKHTLLTPQASDRWIARLGYAGLLPFAFLTLCVWVADADLHPVAALSLQAYGAVIVSFLGGTHWTLGVYSALTQRHAKRTHVAWGVAVPLLAWVGVMMPAFAGLPLLAVVLLACYAVDRRTWPAVGLAPWLPLRLHLTLVASACCFLAAGAT